MKFTITLLFATFILSCSRDLSKPQPEWVKTEPAVGCSAFKGEPVLFFVSSGVGETLEIAEEKAKLIMSFAAAEAIRFYAYQQYQTAVQKIEVSAERNYEFKSRVYKDITGNLDKFDYSKSRENFMKEAAQILRALSEKNIDVSALIQKEDYCRKVMSKDNQVTYQCFIRSGLMYSTYEARRDGLFHPNCACGDKYSNAEQLFLSDIDKELDLLDKEILQQACR